MIISINFPCSETSRKIPTKIHQHWAENHENGNIHWKFFYKFIFEVAQHFDDFCWTFEVWAVQKYELLLDIVKSFRQARTPGLAWTSGVWTRGAHTLSWRVSSHRCRMDRFGSFWIIASSQLWRILSKPFSPPKVRFSEIVQVYDAFAERVHCLQ